MENSLIFLFPFSDYYPPHFHILGFDFAVQIDLRTFEVMSGEARRLDILEALDWAKDNAELIKHKWDKLNSR